MISMLTPATLTILGLSVLSTAFISGVFGMAGGLILLGIFLMLLDVAPAMVLHGATQFAANGWRTFLWRQSVVWPILWGYLAGTTAVYLAMRYFAFLPSKPMIYIIIGLLPFATELLPRRWTPDIQKRGAPATAGAIVSFFQILAGVAGNIVDVFFQNSKLDRKQIVATKSATQAGGHVFRVLYFGSFAQAFETPMPVWIFVAAIVLAMLGTSLAGQALQRMSEASFRQYSRWIINSIAVVFLGRGLWLLAAG